METFIVKRDGTREAFSMEKIQRAIAKAFLSVGSFATQDVITNILSRVSVTDGISVEEIQNQVEVALMAERYYTVAKAYMLYRQRHTEDREVRDKLQFLMEYCDASNAATGSKFDANANVENKNMATLIGELPKSNFIRLNRRMLTDRLKEMYGKELADKYIEMLISSTKTTKLRWPTIALRLRCIPGSSEERFRSGAIRKPRPTSSHSAAAS